MKAPLLAELISHWTKDELFRLFSIAREEAHTFNDDEFSIGMTMLLMEWRSSYRSVNQNRVEETSNHRESVDLTGAEQKERVEA